MARRALAAIAAAIIVLGQLPAVAGAAPPARASGLRPEVRLPVRSDRSAPLATLHPTNDKAAEPQGPNRSLDLRELPKSDTSKGAGSGSGGLGGDGTGTGIGKGGLRLVPPAPVDRFGEPAPAPRAVAPTAPVAPTAATFTVDFEGVPNVDEVLPPDTNGDIGPDHYMEWVNLSFQVFDRAGTPLLLNDQGDPAPRPGNSLWAGFGGICESSNDGDPIAQYDHLADRWMVSQFALFGSDGNHQCIAVSVTPDPTGEWYRYDFLVSATKINDYPKFGVWPDAYYMTVNQFDQDTFAWGGAGVAAFDRSAMLAGQPDAAMVYFDLHDVNSGFGGMLPADADGLLPPPPGAPGLFAEVDDDAFGVWPGRGDTMSLWQFAVDWDDPASSTFGIGGQPNQLLDVAPFEAELCGFSRSCIPQPDTDQGLDAISDRLMYRLQYRNFGDYATLVTNHTVDADGNDHAGVRWYELHGDPATEVFGIHDQGTYAPDAESRWMGSAALDASGNLLVGYSVSSESTYPSIRVAGRLKDDPPGTLPQPEVELKAGTGSQTFFDGRWGDYSMMAVDPTDDCTFWYTNEYLVQTSVADWHTRIGALKYPSCTTGPRGRVQGTVTKADGGDPIEGARVDVGQASTFTDAAGHYVITVPTGTYDITGSAYGFAPESVADVVVAEDATVTQDFALEALPSVVVSGTVRDGSGHGWPLYARIDVGGGYPGGPIFTDPETGAYEVTLFQQTPYPFKVRALVPGYAADTRIVEETTATATEDFALAVDQIGCSAPGYQAVTEGRYEGFPDPYKPVGWLVINNLNGGTTWRFDDPGGRGNLTGGSGSFAVVDSDFAGPEVSQDTELWSPRVNLSTVDEPVVSFRTDFFDLPDTSEFADVDLSLDGGDTWDNLWHQDGTSVRGPAFVELPIPQAAGASDVRVRFHYSDATWAWWWEIDDVTIGERHCVPVDGGLVIGNVYDDNTGDAVDTATVASVDAPSETTTTGPTPADPGIDDGFYVLFSSLTGDRPFSASKKNYLTDTQTAAVVADAVVRRDFRLAAGQLSAAPSPIEVTVPFGGTDGATVTLSNTGGADVAWEAAERDAGREILAPRGALNRDINGRFSPHAFDPKLGKGKIPKRITRPDAPPWTDIADYPSTIMDNTADVLDGLVYSVGGFDGNSGTAAGYRYDPSSNSWAPIASMADARQKPAAAFVNGLLYVVGGWGSSGDPVATLEVYDPASDSWSSGSDVPAPYAAAVAVSLDGQLYVIGGCGAFSCGVTDAFRYDPASDAWTPIAAYPEPTSWEHCGTIEGRIYCAGGVSDANGESSNTFVYDPAADAWSSLASMPQTRWAGGYIGVDGLLIVSGGVTNDFQTVTNEGFAYDPAADAWSPIPASNNVVYRGGSACGFYKLGGSLGGFNPTAASEVLPDLTDCGGGVDVTWLSVSPTEGVVPAAGGAPGTQDIELAFDASVPEVDQPGTYRAFVSFKEDTPYSTEPVEVILHVEPAAGTAKLEGTVSGLARCDAPGGPLAGATVAVDGQASDVVLKTDAAGYFTVWMDETNAPLTLTVSAAGFVGQAIGGVALASGQTTTQDVTLRLDAPCASIAPTAIDLTVPAGSQLTTQLDLSNAGGAAGYDFGAIAETAYELSAAPAGPILPTTRDFAAPSTTTPGAMSVLSQQRRVSRAPVPAALPGWLGASDLPTGAVRYAHAQCDGDPDHFYVIGGVDSNFSVTDATWRYDAASDSWTELAPIPAGSEAPTGVCYGGRIHVLGGGGSDAHWVYDILTDSWSAGAPVPRPLAGGAAAAWDGRIYLAGGDDDFVPGNTSANVDVYDIASDTWIGTAAPLPVPTSFAGSFQAGRYLFLVGGWDDGSPAVNVSAVQRYDLVTDTWETGPALEPARSDLALAASDSALYVIGGDADGGEFFDAVTNTDRLDLSAWPAGGWTALPALSMPLVANSAGFCSQGLGGGEVWSVGGARVDSTHYEITGRAFFHLTGETCPTIRSDVPWLSEDPTAGTVGPDGSVGVGVAIDAGSLDPGEYVATLIVPTTDPALPQALVPVHVTVVASPALEMTVSSRITVGGVRVHDEDVFSITDGGTVALVFDGSDVGIRHLAIDGYARLDDGSLLFSFTAPGSVPGINGTVDDSDLVHFVPTSLGTTTAGAFSMYFDGSDVGLDQSSEDVDAFDRLADGSLVLSTVGDLRVGSLRAVGQDLVRFVPTSLGRNTTGVFSMYFDGSDVGLMSGGENVDAVAVRDDGSILLSTTGSLWVPGLSAANEDVVVFVPTHLGTTTSGAFEATPRFDGSAFGLASTNVVAVETP